MYISIFKDELRRWSHLKNGFNGLQKYKVKNVKKIQPTIWVFIPIRVCTKCTESCQIYCVISTTISRQMTNTDPNTASQGLSHHSDISYHTMRSYQLYYCEIRTCSLRESSCCQVMKTSVQPFLYIYPRKYSVKTNHSLFPIFSIFFILYADKNLLSCLRSILH